MPLTEFSSSFYLQHPLPLAQLVMHEFADESDILADDDELAGVRSSLCNCLENPTQVNELLEALKSSR